MQHKIEPAAPCQASFPTRATNATRIPAACCCRPLALFVAHGNASRSRWLAKEHFEALRGALKAGRMRLEHASLAEHLLAETAKAEADKKFKAEVYTIASLLDHMDWMPARIIDDEMAALLPRMSSNGRIWWRSFGDTDLAHSPPLRWLNGEMVADCTKDRVAMYWSTWLADLSKSDVQHPPMPNTCSVPEICGALRAFVLNC